MPYTTDIQRGGIIDIISSNTISTTPIQSESNSMYIVGEDKAFITVQHDTNKKVSSSRQKSRTSCSIFEKLAFGSVFLYVIFLPLLY